MWTSVSPWLAAQSPEQRAAILGAMQHGLGEAAAPSPWGYG